MRSVEKEVVKEVEVVVEKERYEDCGGRCADRRWPTALPEL